MKTYQIYYRVDGVMTMLPLSVIVKSDNEEKARIEAEKKIKEIDIHVKMGNKFWIN